MNRDWTSRMGRSIRTNTTTCRSCYVNWQAHFLFCYCFSKGVCNFLGQLDPKVPGFQSRVFIFRLQTLQAKVLLLA